MLVRRELLFEESDGARPSVLNGGGISTNFLKIHKGMRRLGVDMGLIDFAHIFHLSHGRLYGSRYANVVFSIEPKHRSLYSLHDGIIGSAAIKYNSSVQLRHFARKAERV